MHSEEELHAPTIDLQGLASSIAEVVNGGDGSDVQAPGVVLATVHAVPLVSARAVVQSSANKLMLDNYVSVNGVGQVLLDESVELRGEDLPQSRADDGSLHRNLVVAYAA